MKKILSVALSTAMAFSMFASVAFGAEANLTPQQKFDVLKEAQILTGMPDGSSALDKTLTRAELAKIIVKSIGLEEVNATSYNDKNYSIHWARTFIEAATQAGILEGTDATKKLFNPSGNVTVQELAAVLVRALKLEVPADANNSASAWAKGYVQAAVDAGFIDASATFTANATRSQAVVAAYAIYDAANFKVTKAEAVDATHVKLTLSTGEVVDVTLTTPLVANTATDLEYTTADGKVLKYTVTWVVTAASKVESVKGDNLREFVVTFDGDLDATTAGNKENYKADGIAFESATVKDNTVTLLATEGSTVTNQKEIALKIDGVKNSDGSKTFKEEVKFTPVDVAIPAVKSVTALGTKAFRVEFSEPVRRADASSIFNYKVDDKVFAGTIKYSYPNVVIVSANLEVGAHKLTVSNITDFSGLKIAPVTYDFTVAEDKTAPEVVSAKSNDLKEVVVEFDEPIASVSKAYFTSTVNGGTVSISDNKVTVKFSNALSLSETTVYLEGVTDYSGNSANREVKITPTLDTARPEVKGVTTEDSTANHVFKVTYSKKVNDTSAKTATNYTLKDEKGKVVAGFGLDANGHPLKAITLEKDDTVAVITLAGKLPDGKYVLEVNNIRDTAYVGNYILPFSTTIDIAAVKAPTITRSWIETATVVDFTKTYYDYAVYVQFSKPVATEGVGSALEISKYQLNLGAAGAYIPVDKDSRIQLVTPDTVRISLPRTETALSLAGLKVKATLIADTQGKFIQTGSAYEGVANVVSSNLLTTSDYKAINPTTVEFKVAGKLAGVTSSDFYLNDGTTTVNFANANFRYDDNNTIVTLTLSDSDKLPATGAGAFKLYSKAQANITSADAFGAKVTEFGATGVTVADAIAPTAKNNFVADATVPTATPGTLVLTVEFDEAIAVVNASALVDMLEVKLGNDKLDINTVAEGTGLDVGKLVITAELPVDKSFDQYSPVYINYTSSTVNALVDKATSANKAGNFNLARTLGEAGETAGYVAP